MAVHKTTDGRWFVAHYQPGSRQAKKKYFGRGEDAELAARQWFIDYRKEKRQGTSETFEVRTDGLTFLELA